MKFFLLAFGLVLLPARADVAVGDRPFEVLEALGQPMGFAGSDGVEVYLFERGEVVFRDGVVQSHTIISEEEFQRRQEVVARQRDARLAREREARERERQAREARFAEGLALREAKAGDPHFNALPASSRLVFWQVFRQKYPEVDVDLEYSVAYEEARHEKAARFAEAEQARRLHELEMRVRQAEYEAERYRRDRVSSYYPESVVYVHKRPVVVVRDQKKWPEQPPQESKTEAPPPPRREDMRERLQPDRFMFPPLKSSF